MVKKTEIFAGNEEGLHMEAGDTLRLDCFVDGSPQPTIVWFKVRKFPL